MGTNFCGRSQNFAPLTHNRFESIQEIASNNVVVYRRKQSGCPPDYTYVYAATNIIVV